MSDDINENITITGESSGAITALDGAINSVGRFDDKVKSLGDTFSKPLEHAGVDIFGKQLLKSMGLAGEARSILQVLNVAVSETATAFGFAAGAAGLAVFGLGALAAIIYKLVESHNKHKESLVKLIESQVKSFNESEATVRIFDELHKNLTTKLSPAMAEYEKSIRAVNAAQSQTLITSLKKEIEDNNESIKNLTKANKSYQATIEDQKNAQFTQVKGLEEQGVQVRKISNDIKDFTRYIGDNATKIKNLTTANVEAKAKLEALAHGFSTAEEYAKSLTKSTKDLTKADDALARQIDALNSLEKQHLAESAALSGFIWQAKTSKIQAELSKQTSAIMDHYRKGMEAAKKSGADTTALTIAALKAVQAAQDKADSERGTKALKWHGISIDLINGVAIAGIKAGNTIADGMGKGFAEMLVDGKSWNKSMTALFHDLKVQFIADVTSMMIKWAAFQALKKVGLFTSGGAAAAVFAAQGFVGTVNKPTTFVAGEGNEDEFVSIIPKSQMAQGVHPFTPGAAAAGAGASAGGSGGGGDTFNIGPFIAQGNDNPSGFAQKVMEYILRETRGRGQITVKSASIH